MENLLKEAKSLGLSNAIVIQNQPERENTKNNSFSSSSYMSNMSSKSSSYPYSYSSSSRSSSTITTTILTKNKPISQIHNVTQDESDNGKIKRREVQETFEPASFLDAIFTYLCFGVLFLVGYVKDFIKPRTDAEKNRQGYAPLYASFESFFTAHVYRPVRDCWNRPICSAPGDYVTIMDRTTPDYGWTFKITGKTNKCINLGSYNYLGFAENSGTCAETSIQSIKKYGVATSSARRELGSSVMHKELDDLVAKFLGTEDALTFAMGFATNALNLPALMGPGCLVFSDEKNHASIILGLRMSGASIRVFKHNNASYLEKKMRDAIVEGDPKRGGAAWKKIFIVTEGVYSMEGSIVKLPEMIDIKRKYGAYLYVDEAHSIGALGSGGRGVVDYWNCDSSDVDILMGTFTKSFGSAGGYIAGSRKLISLLKKNSHAHCYGTAMNPPVVQQIISSMKIIMGEDGTKEGVRRIRQLAANSRYFRQKLKQRGFIVYGNYDSPVAPVALYMPSKIAYCVRELAKRGVVTVGVGYPATKFIEGRARFCLSAAHTKEMLDHAIEAMTEVGMELRVCVSKLERMTGEIAYEKVVIEEDE